jgi:tetratricopeptide (TPR) repeat protein
MAPPAASSAPQVAVSELQRNTILLAVLALVVLTFAVYEPSLHNGFINFDDPDYIIGNAVVQQGLTWHGIVWAFTTTDQANWHPLTWISLMGSTQFLGHKPFAYHFANLVLHTLNVVLLFLLLRKATGFVARSAAVAALFAVFPLNVEAVAWATERKSVLSTLFMLLTLLAYGWYVQRRGAGRYLLVMLAFALALMTKAWVVSLPCALVLLDFWPFERIDLPGVEPGEKDIVRISFGQALIEKIPLLALSAASVAISMHAARTGGALNAYSAHAPLLLRLENGLWCYVVYIARIAWPFNLSIIYPFPTHFLPVWKLALAALVLIAVSAIVWRHRARRYLLTGWLWFLGMLFPLIGLVQTGPQSMADRWAYVSFLGLFVMLVWWVSESAAPLKLKKGMVAALAVAVIVAYAAVAHAQVELWQDSYTLFSHAVAVTRDNGFAENNLGFALQYDLDRPELALAQFQAATRLTPYLPTAHYNVGVLLQSQRKYDEAFREYQLALACSWNGMQAAQIRNNLGTLLLAQNNPEAALSEFNQAVQADPTNDYAVLNRAMLEYHERNLDAARDDFQRAIHLLPTAGTYFMLGQVLEDKGDLKSAADAYAAAVRTNPGLTHAQAHLDAIRAKLAQ